MATFRNRVVEKLAAEDSAKKKKDKPDLLAVLPAVGTVGGGIYGALRPGDTLSGGVSPVGTKYPVKARTLGAIIGAGGFGGIAATPLVLREAVRQLRKSGSSE